MKYTVWAHNVIKWKEIHTKETTNEKIDISFSQYSASDDAALTLRQPQTRWKTIIAVTLMYIFVLINLNVNDVNVCIIFISTRISLAGNKFVYAL